MNMASSARADACLLLADGTAFHGEAIGAEGPALGELCFNTGMTGYQEVLTDPSYAGQIITFTFPHIGNVGCNPEDLEAHLPHARGLVVRERPTPPSNFRATEPLDAWLKEHKIAGICGVDTRALTRHIRMKGAQNAAIFGIQDSEFRIQAQTIARMLAELPLMEGLDLASSVTSKNPYVWTEGTWHPSFESRILNPESYHVVAIDYGEKLNILRSLAERGCKVTVVPAKYSAEQILALKPDGIFLSNGPGDPAAVSTYSTPVLGRLVASGVPIFGICLGHQLLALALGGKTSKMHQGHRGVNHPVKNMLTGTVEITSQNHGFAVMAESLPQNAQATHVSLFDGCLEGFRLTDKPVFAVQYHPESSPGPHDSQYLFDEFVTMMEERIQDSGSRIQERNCS
ncbi:MAG: glutamine-hydrolyzing carbamoyl-phosphate synthase small subunit [Alphaproteobacteria bacterium]|nr:glutamine-hydrolyzing carbamoyl-phosphate synthase small subunit [Alphaproteobacteria bacterium]